MTAPRTVSFLLHAHLPYGLRPDLPISLEAAWLFEAVTDCYLPLLELISHLPKTTQPLLTVSLSPTLLEMWAHPEFVKRYTEHLNRISDILLAEEANEHFPAERRALARQIRLKNKKQFKRFFQGGTTLPAIWAKLAQQGKVELITTAATHAFLPAHQHSAITRQRQIETGLACFEQHIGHRPTGFWLPECAYYPSLEDDLAAAGITWFAVEDMGGGTVTRCPNGVFAIARHGGLSRKVWDAQVGYPGNPIYREFHRDAVHDLSNEQAGLYRLPEGSSLPLGLKYWAVTGRDEKAWYAPLAAQAQAEADANDFVKSLLHADHDTVLLPFDAELFGHWWHEGPYWLAHVLESIQAAPEYQLSTPTDALNALVPEAIPTARPRASTWGRNADFSFWINPETDWIYPQLALAESILARVKITAPSIPLGQRVIAQMTRELLLAQASDWPFMVRAGATVDYAEDRLRGHLGNFHELAKQIQAKAIDEQNLIHMETQNPLFPSL